MNDCCVWTGEIYDDTLKQMFQADEAYAHGDTTKALAYLKSQTVARLPLIKHKADTECGRIVKAPVKMLQADLDKIAEEMADGQSTDKVHALVMATDKKYAIAGYEAFCACKGGRRGR